MSTPGATPSTPLKVPASAAGYTPATQDPELRSQVNMCLIQEGYVTKIQERLLHTLHAHKDNWPTQVQTHALDLLRSGEVTTFPALIRRVIEDIRLATEATSASTSPSSPSPPLSQPAEANGSDAAIAGGGVNGMRLKRPTGAEGKSVNPGLAVPQVVVGEALRVTREALDSILTIGEGRGAA